MSGESSGQSEPDSDLDTGDLDDHRSTPVSKIPLREAWRWLIPGVVGAAALLVAALVPSRAASVLPRAVGCAALIVLVMSIWRAVRASPARYSEVAILAVGAFVAVGLVVDPVAWLDALARVGGLVLVLGALAARFGRARTFPLLRRSAWIRAGVGLLGLALLVWPSALAVPALWMAGLGLLVWSAVDVGVRLGIVDIERSARGGVFTAWLEAKAESTHDRPALYVQLFFEGRDGLSRSVRFALMMLFASVVSALGVLTDSTVVVVGAMLVAPLINPMMGMALALAMGWPQRLARSSLMVVGGAAIALATGWCLSAVLDLGVDLTANSQILIRTSPTIADLIIAAAAGGAGAYALSRPDLSSSLPGVAVAIALVPPLSVVGVSAQAGNWSQAAGTGLLFLTNLVAILIVGGVVFVVTGVAPMRRVAQNQQRVRTSLMAVVALAVLVVGGLVANGRVITADALNSDEARRAVVDWLGDDSDFTIASVDLDDDDVTVVLVGPGEPPPADELGARLVEAIGGPVHLDLQWVPRQRRLLDAG